MKSYLITINTRDGEYEYVDKTILELTDEQAESPSEILSLWRGFDDKPKQTYISWYVPKDWHIILTANPDNGDYMVNSVDSAQKTRYITANLKFDVNVWARWAEEAGIDTRCINYDWDADICEDCLKEMAVPCAS